MKRNTEFLANIRRIGRAYDNMLKPICHAYGLTLVEATIISFLYNNPGRDTAGDIVELRMLSKGNVSQGVESLIQRGLLSRQPDLKDRRKIHLSLLAASEPITKQIASSHKAFHEKIFEGFSEEERQVFFGLSSRIIENTKSIFDGTAL